jgi:alkylated DNA repair dioxygenase AlkB
MSKLITNYFKSNTSTNKANNNYEFWEYFPRKFSNFKYDEIYNDVYNLLIKNSSRYSCVLSDREQKEYTNIPTFFWTPLLETIKDMIETEFNLIIDYGLVHLYKDGESNISWHSDKEAYNSFICSVSFGTERIFCLREIKNNENKVKFQLSHGDLFIMRNGCQEVFEHSILKDSKVYKPRISITFRERK